MRFRSIVGLTVLASLSISGRLLGDNAYLMKAALPPVDSAAVLSVAWDAAPGSGFFDTSFGPTGVGYPLVGVCLTGERQFVYLARSEPGRLRYCRFSGGEWDSSVAIAEPGNDPNYPTHSIAASKRSERTVVTWVDDDTVPSPAFYRLSSDAGRSWSSITQLEFPPGFRGDTVTSFHLSSLYPYWDTFDRLHIVAAVYPVINDTGFVTPAEIWHWCARNDPAWSRVARAGCEREHLSAPVGYNALYACRPSIGFSSSERRLVAVWEQFDSSNIEPGPPSRLRADIFAARSIDSGCTWSGPERLLAAGTASCRFPCISPENLDSLNVVLIADRQAGFCALGEGPATNNPVLALRGRWHMVPEFAVDTIGGTCQDLQSVGPSRIMATVDPVYGLHAVWQYSAHGSPFPDLDMRYNFLDCALGFWNFIDSADFMNSGAAVFRQRIGEGSLDFQPESGVEVISGSTFIPVGVCEDLPRNRETQHRMNPSRPTAIETSSSVEILDISGRRVATTRENPYRLARLAPGVYFIRPSGPARTQKLVILD